MPIHQTRIDIETQNRHWTFERGPGEFVVIVNGQRRVTRCGRLDVELSDDAVVLGTGTSDCNDSAPFAAAALGSEGIRGEQEARVLAQRLQNDQIELNLQRRVNGVWQAPLAVGVLPVVLKSGFWTVTEAVALPRPTATITGSLRDGASIRTIGSELRVTVDGVQHTSNCGTLLLRSFSDSVLLDSYDEQCTRSVALATVCAEAAIGDACDVQRNQVYDWERAYELSVQDIRLTIDEAQSVIDAIYGDYFPRKRPPQVVFSSDDQSYASYGDRTIALADWGFRLDAVIHEVGHLLVWDTDADEPGHGGAFVAVLLELWRRYAPLIDVDAARIDADLVALNVDDQAAIRPVSRAGIDAVRRIICDYPAKSAAYCRAFAGEMGSVDVAEALGRYVGSGWRGNDLWWGARTDEETGEFRSYLALESSELVEGESVARLSIECSPDDELEFDVWWRGVAEVPGSISWRVDDGAWVNGRWETFSGGTWGDDSWAIHRAPDSRSFLEFIHWHASDGGSLSVRYMQGDIVRTAEFKLSGIFNTPVQTNLAQCGATQEPPDSDVPVIDWGRYGDGFWWGVDEDEEPLRSFVVMDTTIAQTRSDARLSIQCEKDRLEVDVYWEVEQDLDWTILYRLNDGSVQSEEWMSGWGTWGDTEYKWTGLEQADALIAELAWAAQADGRFTVQARARDDHNQLYTASFDLDGLFETPVQPNLARCGR